MNDDVELNNENAVVEEYDLYGTADGVRKRNVHIVAPQRSAVKGSREAEELKEIKEQNRQILASYLDISYSKKTWQYVAIFLIVFFVIAFLFYWISWAWSVDNDDFTNLNGNRFHDEDEEFMGENDDDASSYYTNHRNLLFKFPNEALMKPSAGFCSNFVDFACGSYNESHNYFFSEMKESNNHRTNALIKQNLITGVNANLQSFMRSCMLSLSGVDNTVDIAYLLLSLRKLSASDKPYDIMMSFGLSPLIIFSNEDGFIDWSMSNWMSYKPLIVYAACAFLKENKIDGINEHCADDIGIFYKELDNIAGGDSSIVYYTSDQVAALYGSLIPSSMINMQATHRIWSEVQLRHLASMVNHPSFKMWLLVLTVMDAMQYVSSQSLWYMPADKNDTLSYYALSYKFLDRHLFGSNNNHHIFRHGVGMNGLALAHAIPFEKALDDSINSCAILASEMLPHDVEMLRDHVVAEGRVLARFASLKTTLLTLLKDSKIIPDEVKEWMRNWIGHFKLQLGFPGEGIRLHGNYHSFLEMAWDIRHAHLASNFHLSWSPSFHASTCNADVFLNEQLITVPYCLYGTRQLGVALDFILAHEMMHLMYPQLMKSMGAPSDVMNHMHNRLTCFEITSAQLTVDEISGLFLERFADIMGARLAYQNCISEKRCATKEATQAFLLEIAQLFCNNQAIQRRFDVHGSDRSRLDFILKNLLDADRISPFNKNQKCHQSTSSCYYF